MVVQVYFVGFGGGTLTHCLKRGSQGLHLHIYFCYLLLDVVCNSCHLLVLVQLSLVSIRSSISVIFTSIFYCFLRVGTYPCTLQSQGNHSYPYSEEKFSLQLWQLPWVDPIGSLGKNFKFFKFSIFTLVFKNVMLDLFKFSLFLVFYQCRSLSLAELSQTDPVPVTVGQI